MVGAELVSGAIQWVFGSIEGLTMALTLAFFGWHTRKGAAVGGLFSNLGWYAILLALMVVLGVVDLHPGRLLTLAMSAMQSLTGVLG
ncbi:hypothetical protein ACFQH6_19360 [Halobacteriaceae archaeon GCM10025711]